MDEERCWCQKVVDISFHTKKNKYVGNCDLLSAQKLQFKVKLNVLPKMREVGGRDLGSAPSVWCRSILNGGQGGRHGRRWRVAPVRACGVGLRVLRKAKKIHCKASFQTWFIKADKEPSVCPPKPPKGPKTDAGSDKLKPSKPDEPSHPSKYNPALFPRWSLGQGYFLLTCLHEGLGRRLDPCLPSLPRMVASYHTTSYFSVYLVLCLLSENNPDLV